MAFLAQKLTYTINIWFNFVFDSFFEQDHLLPLFRMGGKKALSTSFSLVTSTNLGISPQNFLTFSFDPFVTLV